MSAQAGRSGAGDFDFFIGRWRIHHRRLNERLASCTDWTEFEGSCETRKILGGLGNMDDNFLDFPGDAYRAVTLRTYNRKPGSGRSGGSTAAIPARSTCPSSAASRMASGPSTRTTSSRGD